MQAKTRFPRAFVIAEVRLVHKLGLIILAAGFIATLPVRDAQATNWRGIIPTQSDKKDVITHLGKPKTETLDRMEFEDKTGKTEIFFYTTQDTTDLKLSPELAGRVLTVYFYPKRPQRYKLDQLAHKVVSVGHGMTINGEKMTSYDDGEHGISYHFKDPDTRVWRIVYYAPRSVFAKFRIEQK